MNNYKILNRILWVMLISWLAFISEVRGCTINISHSPLSANLPINIQLPDNVDELPSGAVLFHKEVSLDKVVGLGSVFATSCSAVHNLSANLPGSEIANHLFATGVAGIGVRLTLVYGKSGNWVFPFQKRLQGDGKPLHIDDFLLRIEIIKDSGGTRNPEITHPLLLTMEIDNAFINMNIYLHFLQTRVHCSINSPTPQVTLPPISAEVLYSKRTSPTTSVNVILSCSSTHIVNIQVKGEAVSSYLDVFRNLETISPAEGVGIQMLYSGRVISPDNSFAVNYSKVGLPMLLPLRVRYAKINEHIAPGRVSAKITLNINHL